MRRSLSCMELRPVTGQSPPLRSAPLSRHPCGNSSFLHHSSHYCCRHTTTDHLEAVTGHTPRRHPSHLVAIHSMREGRPRETPASQNPPPAIQAIQTSRRTTLLPPLPTHTPHRQSRLRRYTGVTPGAASRNLGCMSSPVADGREAQSPSANGWRRVWEGPSSPQTSVQGIEAMSRIVGGISHEMPVTSHHWASNAQQFWLEGIAELTHIKCQNAIYALLSPPFLPLTAFPDSPRLSTTSPLLPTENPTCSLPAPADPPSPPKLYLPSYSTLHVHGLQQA